MLSPSPVEPSRAPAEEPAVVDEVLSALEPLTQQESLPTTDELFTTLIDAGYEAAALETTIDESPLGNEVPAKMFGVRVEEGCVVGEIRAGDATAELMPPGESTGSCLMGRVERPEGAPEPSGESRDEDGSDNGAGHIPGEDINRPRTQSPEPEEPDDGSAGGGAPDSGGSGTGGSGGADDAPAEEPAGPPPALGGS
nr:hypothetical protein [Brevibacterium daeguense]